MHIESLHAMTDRALAGSIDRGGVPGKIGKPSPIDAQL
jgi:hypothetical protein